MEYYVTRANEVDTEDELYHYGVKGMKWGVRRKYPTVAQAHRIARKAGNEARKESIAKSRATDGGIGSLRRANQAANKARKEAYRNSLKEQKAAIKADKADRKQKIKSAYKEINKNSSIGEKFMYNNATRKKAAKYMVDHNMSMKDAKERANKDAERNTAALLAGYGAVTLGTLYLQSKI